MAFLRLRRRRFLAVSSRGLGGLTGGSGKASFVSGKDIVKRFFVGANPCVRPAFGIGFGEASIVSGKGEACLAPTVDLDFGFLRRLRLISGRIKPILTAYSRLEI